MKKLHLVFLLIFLCATIFQAAAEQLTKVGVVDMTRIITAFYKKSPALRDLQEYWAKTEEELDKMSKEISDLEKLAASAKDQGDDSRVRDYNREIENKKNYRKDYYKRRYDEYKRKYDNFGKTDDFFQKVQRAISAVAVRESYSVVMKSDDPAIVYYSKDVDITDDVIEFISR